MKDLSRHIEYLLCEHDSVAIPSIGTFTTEELPARYYMEENTYLPPVKSVRLDINQKHDDGKLENCLIHLHRVTHNVAQKWISDYVNNINQSLVETGFMDIGTIGRLVYVNDKVSFEVCEAGVNSPEWYGLDSFQMPKLPAYAHKNQIYKDPTHFTIRLRRSTVHRVMTAAAMIIVALTVIVPNYGAFNFKSKLHAHFASAESLITLFDTHQQAIIEPASVKAESQLVVEQSSLENENQRVEDPTLVENEPQSVAEPVTIEEESQSAILSAETPAETEQTLNVKEDITQDVVIEETVETSPLEVKGYCVVMASAITNKGAEHLINKLNKEGFSNAVKFDDKGMLRVVLTGYESEEAARADMAIVRATDKLYSGSWLKHF